MLFGLPLGGDNSFSSIVDTRAAGPAWLTGGEYGPAAAAFSIFASAGCDSGPGARYQRLRLGVHPSAAGPRRLRRNVAPPAAHIAMEQAAESAQTVNPAVLVQILPGTPQGAGVRTPSE